MNRFTPEQVLWLNKLETSTKCTDALSNGRGAYCCLGVAAVSLGIPEACGTFEFSDGASSDMVFLNYERLHLKSESGMFYGRVDGKLRSSLSLADLNDETAITHRGIRALIIDYPALVFNNFDPPPGPYKIKLKSYIGYDEVEPIPTELLPE
jgi:hypothetical protein